MKAKLTVLRAISALIIRRFVFWTTLLVAAAFLLLFGLVWYLAATFSAWWWIMLLPLLALLFLFLVIRLIVVLLANSIYKVRVSASQKQQLESFVNKIQGLLEVRAMGWPLFLAASVKDLVLHKELRTVNSLLADSKSLRKDFAELEKEFTA